MYLCGLLQLNHTILTLCTIRFITRLYTLKQVYVPWVSLSVWIEIVVTKVVTKLCRNSDNQSVNSARGSDQLCFSWAGVWWGGGGGGQATSKGYLTQYICIFGIISVCYTIKPTKHDFSLHKQTIKLSDILH